MRCKVALGRLLWRSNSVKVIGALATETMFSKDIAFSRTPAPGWASLLAAGLTDFVKSSTERNLFIFLGLVA
jgi:hypothetical protein